MNKIHRIFQIPNKPCFTLEGKNVATQHVRVWTELNENPNRCMESEKTSVSWLRIGYIHMLTPTVHAALGWADGLDSARSSRKWLRKLDDKIEYCIQRHSCQSLSPFTNNSVTSFLNGPRYLVAIPTKVDRWNKAISRKWIWHSLCDGNERAWNASWDRVYIHGW